MPAAGWRNDLGFLQTMPKQFSPPSPNGLALWSIRTCCNAGNMSNSLERQWSMNQTVPIQGWSFWSNLGVWSSSLKRQWSINHTGERIVWCLFALDAKRNGKVQRILASISMCPALNSFSAFSNYFVNVCKIWLFEMGEGRRSQSYLFALTKVRNNGKEFGSCRIKEKVSKTNLGKSKKKRWVWDLLILRVDKNPFTSKPGHLHSQMLHVVLDNMFDPTFAPYFLLSCLFEPSGSWPYSRPLQPCLWNICHEKPSTLGCSEEVVWIPFLIWLVVSNMCYFHPYLRKRSNLTNIFQFGLKPPTSISDGFHFYGL